MKTVVIAPRGKMGSAIVRVAAERADLRLVAAVGAPGAAYIGRDLGEVALLGRPLGVPVTDDLETAVAACDVIIDFSAKEMAPAAIAAALRHGKALVCGTTALGDAVRAQLEAASARIPVMHAANTSRMVFVLNRMLAMAASALGDKADVEILDLHDRRKLDAPSGTALELGETVARARGIDLESAAIYGRRGQGVRGDGAIAFHALRAGDVPSSHTVFLGGLGERLELTHHAYNMDCFAHGACDCAAFLAGQGPGLYTVADVFA